MKKLIILLFIANLTFAQDTIRFFDGEVKAIKIVQITSFGVKYYNFNDLEGKLLFSVKKDVAYLKYQGGEMDSLKKKITPIADDKSALNNASGQDTIRFRNGTNKAVKVTIVEANEIKYKRLDNISGPVYTAAINDIELIKYSSGVVDSFAVVESRISTDKSIAGYKQAASENKIVVEGDRMYFNQRSIGEKHVFDLVYGYPEGEKKEKMMSLVDQTKQYKRRQHALGFTVGLGVGVGAPIVGAFAALFDDSWAPFGVGVIVGVLGGVLGVTLPKEIAKKRTAKRLELVRLYNE